MFKNNDFLVAQDRLYKEKVPYRYMYAKYGRYFKCPITYFRVVDRLGVGSGPQVQVVRGGIRYKYIVLRLRSGYNLPISVNIYVGCENKMTRTRATTASTTVSAVTSSATAADLRTTTVEAGVNVTESERTTTSVVATTATTQ
ncbi:unnamed protein product, partial [Iphiclides podalirius]